MIWKCTCGTCKHRLFCKYKEEFEAILAGFEEAMKYYRVDDSLNSKITDKTYIYPTLICKYYIRKGTADGTTRIEEE